MMAGLIFKFCVLSAVLVAVLLQVISSSPAATRTELLFKSESNAVGVLNIGQDCIDQTDCDPYGPYMCNRTKADHKWARACCREYCNYCNLTVPKNQNCDGTPPSFINL